MIVRRTIMRLRASDVVHTIDERDGFWIVRLRWQLLQAFFPAMLYGDICHSVVECSGVSPADA
jgi:hypothetical protein